MPQRGRVLVLGSNGFVGAYLADEFANNGYHVIGADIQGKSVNPDRYDEYHSFDLTNFDSVKSIVEASSADCIVNLAAISSVSASWNNPLLTYQVNAMGTLNLLEAVRKTSPESKVLLVGSSEEYAASNEPLTEEDMLNAGSPYGLSKMSAENIASLYNTNYGLRVYIARSFNHTGVGQSERFVIPGWCKQVAEIQRLGRSGVIKVGNILVSRDISSVSDIVRGYRILLESDFSGIPFNFGSERSLPLSYLLDRIINFSDFNIEVKVDQSKLRPIDNPFIVSDCSRARSLLKWSAVEPIEKTLRYIYDSFLE